MSKKQQQQAADAAMEMDELNLDDLFLGGDGDGAMGGLGAGMMGGTGGVGLGGAIAASLFADMDLDLGCIMDGIMGMEDQTSTVSTDDGGGGGGRVGGYGSNSLRGMMMLDDDFMGGNVDFDDGSSASISAAGGKVSRRRSSTNSIYSAGREAGGGGDTTAAGSNRQKRGKRTRTARSNPHQSAAVMAHPQQNRLHQSREVASLAGPSPSPTSATGAKSRRGDLSSLIVHSNRTKEAKIVHHRNHPQSQQLQQQPLQGVFQPTTSSFQLNRNSNEKLHPQSQASGPLAERKRQDELGSSQLRKAEKELSNFGMPSSRTLFFPFMKLPTNVLDCKNQRGQKSSYPILEKLSVQLAPSLSSKSDEVGPADSIGATTSAIDKAQVPLAATSSMPSFLSSSNAIPTTHSKSLITVSSPIYSLFQHTQSTSPSELIEVLMKSTDAVESTLRQLAKKRRKKNILEQSSIVHHTVSSPQSPPPPSLSSSSSSLQLVDELVKIYLSHLKQSAFLRQNASNMENWCIDHFTNEETRSIFPVDRKSVEQVCNLVWMHDHERISSKHQQQLEEEGRGVGGRRRGAGTGAKSTNLSPIISVEVKVKLTGWREKPGSTLNARLACPKRWKVAMARGASTPTTATAVAPPLDLSTFSRKTLNMVSEEMLRFDVLPPKVPPKKSSCVPAVSAPCSAAEVVSNDTVSETTKNNKSPVLDGGSGTPSMIDKNMVDGKAKRRRKTKKDDVRSASPRSRGSPTIASPEKKVAVQLFSSSSVSKSSVFIPHIPGSKNSQVHRCELHKTNGVEQEGKRIVHALYASILDPAIQPSKRRALLADEVSSTLSRINQQTESASQLSHPLSSSLSNMKRDQISKQIADSQAAYLDDVELMPTTVGMWKCLENANYFEVIEKEEDVSLALESLWQPVTMEFDDVVNEDGGYYYWGSLPQEPIAVPMDKKVADMIDVAEERVTDEAKSEGKESSPLFDHLQSLLVEVEDDEGVNNDKDDEDDDYLIANLPPYSPEEFIFGPKRGNASYAAESVVIGTSDTDTDNGDDGNDSAMFDQSTLTLDQRIYIQMRAAGLVDCKWRPSHRISSSVSLLSDPLPSGESSPHTTAITESTDIGDDEPVDDIVRKMKHRFSNLRNETNAQVAQLQRLAVANVAKS